MEVRKKIFLSWRKDRARVCVERFEEALISLGLNGKEHYCFSPNFTKGNEWRAQLYDEIRKSKLVVAFLTRENVSHAPWVECECAAVYLAEDNTFLYPCLMDFPKEELPEDSAWKTAFGGVNCVAPEFGEVVRMLHEMIEKCGLKDVVLWEKFDSVVSKLIKDWSIISKSAPHVPAEIPECPPPHRLVDNLKDDHIFEEWAYYYHCVPHFTRDLVVRILDSNHHLENPCVNLAAELAKLNDSEPLKGLFDWKAEIIDLLNYVEQVFQRLVKPGARVWACLRDLRKHRDQETGTECYKYYNFARSIGGGIRENSIAWEKDCEAVEALLNAVSTPSEDPVGRNCTIITPEEAKPPPHGGHRDPKRQQSMLGAVLLKNVKNKHEEPTQSELWWILCVNSDHPATFSAAHKRVLQGCNDAFSVLANTILRNAVAKQYKNASGDKPGIISPQD